MIFSEPLPFLDALQSREVRNILPTALSSREMRDRISAEVLERAVFSAKTTSASYLDTIDALIGQLLNGEINQASARLALKEKLDHLGYVPNAAHVDTLQDLSSDLRLDLILETNVEMAQGYGSFIQGQDEAVLDQFPAQELIRVIDPVGVTRDWEARWNAVGGEIFSGQMIALKNDPIWQRLGSEFDDGLGNPYPPFAFNSGMDVADVDRDTAIALGLIDRDTQITPQNRGFSDDLKYSKEIRSESLRSALVGSDDALRFDAEGVLRIKGRSDQ